MKRNLILAMICLCIMVMCANAQDDTPGPETTPEPETPPNTPPTISSTQAPGSTASTIKTTQAVIALAILLLLGKLIQ